MLESLLILNQWLVSTASFVGFIFCLCRAIFDFAYGRFYQPVGALLFAAGFYVAYEATNASVYISVLVATLVVGLMALIHQYTKIK